MFWNYAASNILESSLTYEYVISFGLTKNTENVFLVLKILVLLVRMTLGINLNVFMRQNYKLY